MFFNSKFKYFSENSTLSETFSVGSRSCEFFQKWKSELGKSTEKIIKKKMNFPHILKLKNFQKMSCVRNTRAVITNLRFLIKKFNGK